MIPHDDIIAQTVGIFLETLPSNRAAMLQIVALDWHMQRETLAKNGIHSGNR